VAQPENLDAHHSDRVADGDADRAPNDSEMAKALASADAILAGVEQIIDLLNSIIERQRDSTTRGFGARRG
jgi:hypothetical protein